MRRDAQIQQLILEQVQTLFSWREKRSGTVMPEERLPWGNTIALGMQHVLAMFGSTVIAPILMGFDPNLAILFSGIGTLLFFVITAGKVPSYLGSSFAFIAPVLAVYAGGGGVKEALGGIVVAGLIYLLIGVAVQYTGSGWIDALMPPLVTGAVVAIIGLNLAGAARDMAQQNMPLAIITVLSVIVVAIVGRGMLGRLPILIGTVAGYLIALLLGGTNGTGRSFGPIDISGVDFQPVRDAAWIGCPSFTGPSFDWHAITLIAPVAIILVAENTGHIKAVSEMTGRNLMPFLGRGFIGDGVATMVAGAGGGTGVTTYAENIGVMAVTKVFSTAMFVVAAVTAIVLGFVPKFGALIGSIPAGVLGGVSTVLFGLIAVTGVRIWVENQVDFSKSSNLFIAAVTLIVGAADYTIHFGDFALAGIGIGTFGAIILYQIFRVLGFDDAVLAADGEPDTFVKRRRGPGGEQSGRGRARREPAMTFDPDTLRQAFNDENIPAITPSPVAAGRDARRPQQGSIAQRPKQGGQQGAVTRDSRQEGGTATTSQQPPQTRRPAPTQDPRRQSQPQPQQAPPQRRPEGQQQPQPPARQSRSEGSQRFIERPDPRQQPPVDPGTRRPPANRTRNPLPDLDDPDDQQR